MTVHAWKPQKWIISWHRKSAQFKGQIYPFADLNCLLLSRPIFFLDFWKHYVIQLMGLKGSDFFSALHSLMILAKKILSGLFPILPFIIFNGHNKGYEQDKSPSWIGAQVSGLNCNFWIPSWLKVVKTGAYLWFIHYVDKVWTKKKYVNIISSLVIDLTCSRVMPEDGSSYLLCIHRRNRAPKASAR